MSETKLVLTALLIAPLFTVGISLGGIQNAHAIPTTDPVILKIDSMIEQVNELDDPDLTDGNIKSLNKKLENTLKDLQKFQDKAACNKLFSFVQELNALVAAKKLDQTQVQNLIDLAFVCINSLCGED